MNKLPFKDKSNFELAIIIFWAILILIDEKSEYILWAFGVMMFFIDEWIYFFGKLKRGGRKRK